MKTTSRSLNYLHSAVLTTLVLFGAARIASANLIVNGGFEAGNFTGWTVAGSLNSVDTNFFGDPPHSGTYLALLNTGSLSQTFATTPGASYIVDFFLTNDEGRSPTDSFTASWGGVPFLSLTNQSFNSHVYNEYTFTGTATGASTTLLFNFSQGTPSDRWLLDDVSVNAAARGVPDTGSTIGLLSLALTALVCANRFRSLRLA